MNNKKNSKLPSWAIALIVLAFVLCLLPIVAILAFAFIFYIFDNVDQINNDLSIDQNVTAIYDKDQNSYVLTGKVSNISDIPYYDIEIEYTFYDKDGNVIGVASDYLEELDEGKTWKFDVEYVGASSGDIISYELTGLEGF